MGDSLAVLLVTGVHAVRVAIAAPAHGDAEPVQPALELVGVAAPRRARGWWEGTRTHSLLLPRGAGNQVGSGGGRRTGHSAQQGKGWEHPEVQEEGIWAPRVGRGGCRIPCLEVGGSDQGGAFSSPGRTAAELMPRRVHQPLTPSLLGQDLGPPRGGHQAAAQGQPGPAAAWGSPWLVQLA